MADQKFDERFKLRYLHPRFLFSWLGIAILAILAYIPSRCRDAIADLTYKPLSKLNVGFKRKALVNLRLAFPDMTSQQLEELYADFLRVGIKVTLGYGIPFFRSREYLKSTYIVTGEEFLKEAVSLNRPILFMAPHAWAIDHCGLYLSASGLNMCTMMHSSKNQVYDWFMNKMRLKFGGKVYERGAGVRSVLKALKDGYHCFFLPDQDLGEKSSRFVKFFAEDKASLIVLPKISQFGNAVILPMFSCYNEERRKYEVVFDHYFDNYPSDDLMKDVRRMNASIEHLVEGREKQYMWFLQIYKSRPGGWTMSYAEASKKENLRNLKEYLKNKKVEELSRKDRS